MERKEKKALATKTLGFFWRHARVYWPMLLLCAIGIAITIGCDLASPVASRKLFNLLGDPIRRTQANTWVQAKIAIGYIVALMLGSYLGGRLYMYSLDLFESKAMKDLADTCFAYIQGHSYRFFTNNFGGALVNRVNQFVSAFETIADQYMLQLGQTVIRIILIITVLFWYNVTLGRIFLGWAVVLISFNVAFSKYKLKFDRARSEMNTKVTARLADTIANAVNLKLFAGIGQEVSSFKALTYDQWKARYASWKKGEQSYVVQGFSLIVLQLVILAVSVRKWIDGVLTLGDVVMLQSYLWQLVNKVNEVGQSVRRIYEAMANANEMTEILVTPHEIVDVPDAPAITVTKSAVEFRGVSFSYVSAGRMVLQDLNLKIKAGERVGIVGPSGGGKSTILKLLVRLHDVTDGSILIDGQNIAKVTQDSLHRSIAYVPQDPILFHRSLMENIRYSRPAATDDEVIRAAKFAHCHEFISNFPEGYQTLVGERGVKLSGGERQRVAIARAILMDAPIIVLDEATSSLDSESELYIQDSLSKLVVGRTVIAVAHRLSTIRKMDRIVVVKDGQIIEQGSHDLLLKIETSLYRRLWGLQTLYADSSVSLEEKYLQ